MTAVQHKLFKILHSEVEENCHKMTSARYKTLSHDNKI